MLKICAILHVNDIPYIGGAPSRRQIIFGRVFNIGSHS